jgi:beta-lactamase regulating signal transducer with metallopeptidase domain
MHLVSHSVFLKTLGWSLLNSVWQMAALWLLYFVVTTAGKGFSAKAKHAIAVLLLSAGTIWFLFSFITNYFINAESSFGDNAFITFSVTNNSYFIFNSAKELFNKSVPYCSVIYLFILVFQLARYSKYYFHSRRLRFEGLHKAQPALRIFVNDVAQQLGIHKKVNVWLSSLADSPMTVGFLKSVILIPIATINHLSTQQVEAILLHELAHIKRNDYFLNLVIIFTGVLFFFNPFARLLIKNIRKEAENCCDDLVMQFRYDPHTYISALLSLEKTRNNQRLAMAAIGSDKQVLLERVKRITRQQNTFQINIPKLLLLFFIALITFAALWFQPQQIISAFTNKTFMASAVSSNEKPQVYYNSGISSSKKNIKTKSSLIIKKKITEPAVINENNKDENNIALVNNNEDDGDENNLTKNAALTIQPEAEKSFSVSQDEENTAPVINEAGTNFPFVPSSSFVYKITTDTKQKIAAAIKKIDFKKINNQINGNAEKLQEQLQKSLAELDSQNSINEESSTNESDDQRIKGDIKVELKALQNSKLKNPEQVQKLQQQLFKVQIKLQRQNLQKQHEILKKIEDEIRTKAKIVYI